MKKPLATVSMALAFMMAAALSAFCANVTGGVSGPSFHSPAGILVSFGNPPGEVLAQAGSGSDEGIDDPQSFMRRLVADGVLTPGGGAEDSQTVGRDSGNEHRNQGDPSGDQGADPPEGGGCKNGNHVGNKHCVPSPSE
jgi:hypothetical protein